MTFLSRGGVLEVMEREAHRPARGNGLSWFAKCLQLMMSVTGYGIFHEVCGVKMAFEGGINL